MKTFSKIVGIDPIEWEKLNEGVADGKKAYQIFLYAHVGHPYGIFVRSFGVGVALWFY